MSFFTKEAADLAISTFDDQLQLQVWHGQWVLACVLGSVLGNLHVGAGCGLMLCRIQPHQQCRLQPLELQRTTHHLVLWDICICMPHDSCSTQEHTVSSSCICIGLHVGKQARTVPMRCRACCPSLP